MTYKIQIKKAALKFIQKQNPAQQKRIFSAIYKLPAGDDIKKMQGMPGVLRLRVGDYRILYTIDNGNLIIEVIDAGNRGDIYK